MFSVEIAIEIQLVKPLLYFLISRDEIRAVESSMDDFRWYTGRFLATTSIKEVYSRGNAQIILWY